MARQGLFDDSGVDFECSQADVCQENAYKQGYADAIDECCNAFNELAIKWFNQSSMNLGDIPRLGEDLKEQNK